MTTLRLPEPLPAEYVDRLIDQRTKFYTYNRCIDLYDGELVDTVVTAARPLIIPTHGMGNTIRSVFDVIPDDDDDDSASSEEHGYITMIYSTRKKDWEAFEELPPEFSGLY